MVRIGLVFSGMAGLDGSGLLSLADDVVMVVVSSLSGSLSVVNRSSCSWEGSAGSPNVSGISISSFSGSSTMFSGVLSVRVEDDVIVWVVVVEVLLISFLRCSLGMSLSESESLLINSGVRIFMSFFFFMAFFTTKFKGCSVRAFFLMQGSGRSSLSIGRATRGCFLLLFLIRFLTWDRR